MNHPYDWASEPEHAVAPELRLRAHEIASLLTRGPHGELLSLRGVALPSCEHWSQRAILRLLVDIEAMG